VSLLPAAKGVAKAKLKFASVAWIYKAIERPVTFDFQSSSHLRTKVAEVYAPRSFSKQSIQVTGRNIDDSERLRGFFCVRVSK